MKNDEAEQRKTLIAGPVNVINVGLQAFADDLKSQGVDVIEVDWKPPARGNPQLAKLLSKLGA